MSNFLPYEENYKYGFSTDIESDTMLPGINESTIRIMSKKRREPSWLLNWRLKAYNHWCSLKQEPRWSEVKYAPINYDKISIFATPKKKIDSLDEVDPEIIKTYQKLGIPLHEQKKLANVAVDAIFDSVSVATTFKNHLLSLGILFCSFSEAIEKYPDIVQKYLGSVVPINDNFFSSLNSAVFSDGSFCYIPENVKCPMELSTYFRLNNQLIGQFERTLIIANAGSFVSYLEGCSAPRRDNNQLHAAVVELVALGNAEIKYATVQNWYPGNKQGVGGIFNFVTKRGICKEKSAKISWIQIENGSAITWKYPSVILKGEDTIGEFYSIAITNGHQQADTGSKMIHIGSNSYSTIISKSILAGHSKNTYRGLVKIQAQATQSRNYSQCDSLLLSATSESNTIPHLCTYNDSSILEHEASTSKVNEDQIFYCQQRGLSVEESINLIVSGFCKSIFQKLPMEFAVEAQKLLSLSLENAIG